MKILKDALLLVDNDADYRESTAKCLEQAGYTVIQAESQSDASQKIRNRRVSAAIIDVRLEKGEKDGDVSGVNLARSLTSTLPKIMLTQYDSLQAAREAFTFSPEGLTAAVSFILKSEGPEVLIQAVEKALNVDQIWLTRVKNSVTDMEGELHMGYQNARWQSWISFAVAVLGILGGGIIIYQGVLRAMNDSIEVAVISGLGGVVTELISLVFLRLLISANERMDRYHQELFQGQRFGTLLQACDGLKTEEQREVSRQSVILAAASKWLNCPELLKSPSQPVEGNYKLEKVGR